MKQQAGDVAKYLFHQGTNFEAYQYLGCHETKRKNGGFSYTFRVWAPNASAVFLVGEFCGWQTGVPMQRLQGGGIWELVYESQESLHGKCYKYRVCSYSGTHLKGDPYATFSRGGDDGATIIWHASTFQWSDAPWLEWRREVISVREGSYLATPVNIYEMHLGSFMKREDGTSYSYREIADKLVPYVKSMGYTHIELMPITEFPYEPSWGYQVCSYFAPTSRYGTPDDFRYFIDTMHKAGVGVILDWVPAHFPKDEWGLYEFDGGPLYEYQGKDRQESRSWGTRFFDVGREEVQSFLISSAVYWLKEFHIDGLRVDAVAAMLYLDFDRNPGEWFPNVYGDNRNLESIAFFQKLNGYIAGVFPDVMMIAEESTSHGQTTRPVSDGGLGFNLKWNMGWANDFFRYLGEDPVHRKYHHMALNFPLMYAFKENYVMPVSHDEVVYGKRSLINKAWGSYEDKLRQFRTAVMLQTTYPGKKMTFMGTEYGQFSEWDYNKGLEWFMLEYPAHQGLREYVAALNRFYLENPALWEIDFDEAGFEWIYPDAADQNMVAFRRCALNGEKLTVVMSFSGGDTTVRIPTKDDTPYVVAFSTVGTGEPTPPFQPIYDEANDTWYFDVPLPRLSGIILREQKHEKIKL